MKLGLVGVVLLMLAIAPLSADLSNWRVLLGFYCQEAPPYDDWANVIGVDPQGTWDYDGRDTVHDPPSPPELEAVFLLDEHYYQIYVDAGIGWPPPWKPQIPPGEYPDYPSPWGLQQDTREPILAPGQPEFWLVRGYAPREGYEVYFDWDPCPYEEPFRVPDLIMVKVHGNSDLEAAGVFGDLILTDYPPGMHFVGPIPQWGLDDDGNPIPHFWVIEARMVPEPTLALGLGSLLVLGAVMIARRTNVADGMRR